MRKFFALLFALIATWWHDFQKSLIIAGEIGGYVHDTAMSQYFPPFTFHIVANTNWTEAAGYVAGTIARHKSAAAETDVVNIPIQIPSNSVALKGSLLKSIEVDYEIFTAACTSVTAVLSKITRGIDTAVAVVSNPAVTQDLVAATSAASVEQHKLTVTLTTPEWIDNDVYFLLKLTIVAAATSTIDLLGAVANYTIRE
jgi:hypothetical protein